MGLSSGLDTDFIIQQTLRLHQLKIDSQFRTRTNFEWKQQALNGVKDNINDFRRSFLTVLGQNAMRLSSTYNSTIATVTGKNASAVSIATSINSAVGSMRIGQIASLAKATSVSSAGSISRNGQGFKLTDKLGNLLMSNKNVVFDSKGEAKVNINGTDVMLNRNESVDDIINGIQEKIYNIANPAEQASEQLRFDNYVDWLNRLEDPMDPESKPVFNDTFKAINLKLWQEGGQQVVFDQEDFNGVQFARMNVNGKSIVVYNYRDEFAPMINGVANANADPDLHSFYNTGFNGIASSANAIGGGLSWTNINPPGIDLAANYVSNFRIGIGSISANFEINKDMTIDDMVKMVNESGIGVTMRYDRLSDGFTIEANRPGATTISVGGLEAFGIYNGNYNNGSMARVQINGEWVESDSNIIDFRGVKITLNSTTAPDEEETLVSLKRDATEPLNKIKTFIEAYNELIKKLEDMLTERKNRDESTYRPLTDEEKSLMSEKQIEEWEAIAKKGLLRNDSGIQALTNSLRRSLFDQIELAGLSPSQIGISTGRWDEGLGGQIVLDEAKLRAALEEDPERVMNVFMGGADSTNQAERGWLWRMEDLMLGYVNGNQYSSLNNLENSIRRANQQMERLQQKMFDEEDRLYKKFAALETAMSKIQQQSDWFSAMLGSMDTKK